MRTSTDELQKRIRTGENGRLGLKEVCISGGKVTEPNQFHLAAELAAFANSQGGELILRVNDKNREITGMPCDYLDEAEELVLQACDKNISPPISMTIERLMLLNDSDEERPVIRVEVERSFTVHQSTGKYWCRQGPSMRIISTFQLSRLFFDRLRLHAISIDQFPVMNARIKDLDEKLWNRFQSHRCSDTPEQCLSKLGMISKDENEIWHPTLAGLLKACKNLQTILANACIQAVAYHETSSNPIQFRKTSTRRS